MKIINLTPHTINIIGVGSFEPSGSLARVAVTSVHKGFLNFDDGTLGKQIPVYQNCYADVEGLPDPKEDTIYLVSGMVLEALKGSGRFDVYAPDTGKSAARVEGMIIGVCNLLCVGE
jgi:hypothetical protein